jgi:hypothetical protein
MRHLPAPQRPIAPSADNAGVFLLRRVGVCLISGDPPEKPPKGGVPVRDLRVLEGGKARAESDDANRRAA